MSLDQHDVPNIYGIAPLFIVGDVMLLIDKDAKGSRNRRHTVPMYLKTPMLPTDRYGYGEIFFNIFHTFKDARKPVQRMFDICR